jgi:hypothetical protein
MTTISRSLCTAWVIVFLAASQASCAPTEVTSAPAPTHTPAPISTALPIWTVLPTSTLPPTAAPTVPSPTPQPTFTAPPTHTPSPTPATPAQALAIVSQARYTGATGAVHVVGLVLNSSNRNVYRVQIVGRFYDQGGRLVLQAATDAYVDILRPGETAPFSLAIEEPPADLGDHVLEASGYETADEPFLGLEFIQYAALLQESPTDDTQSLTIIGELTNINAQPAGQVRVSCAVLDTSGSIVDVEMTSTLGDVFQPGDVIPFRLYLAQVNGDPDHYQILPYGRQATGAELDRQATLQVMGSRRGPAQAHALSVIGEVGNLGSDSAAEVKLSASFYDVNGILVAVGFGTAWRDVLEAGGRSPFAIDLPDPSDAIDHWIIRAQSARSDRPPAELVLENVRNTVDLQNRVTLAGQVRNTGQEPMVSVQVGATIYDAGKQVLAIGRTDLQGDLAPGASMPFEFQIQATEASDSFQLYVQGKTKE